MTPEQILARLKVLLGIDPDDTTHDAELQALFDTALAAARAYTHRWLYPVARFREAFQPALGLCTRCGGRAPVFVSEIPVQEVESATRDGAAVDPATILIAASGMIYEQQSASLLFEMAPFSRLELVYQAGYDELPADIAEALCQVAAATGGATAEALGGTTARQASKMTVFDVGTIEYDNAGPFYSALISPTAVQSALLGPWASVLDVYRDVAKELGAGDDYIHTLENLGAPEA